MLLHLHSLFLQNTNCDGKKELGLDIQLYTVKALPMIQVFDSLDIVS